MGKKSKSKPPKKDRSGFAGIRPNLQGDEIPRLKHMGDLGKKRWQELSNEMGNPVHQIDHPDDNVVWVCLDDYTHVTPGGIIAEDTGKDDGIRNEISAPTACPMCFKPAENRCSKCKSVWYCSVACQKAHWKKSHKKACKPNPGLYQFNVSVSQFRSLPESAFEGHEFLVIKPTEQLPSLEAICDECLESADDMFETMPGFGQNQIDPLWTLQNTITHPAAKALQRRFGWTSGSHGIELMTGYRLVEDHFVYRVMFDDDFLNRRDLGQSYYGDACFDWVRSGRHTRGNLVIWKLLVKNKRREPRHFRSPLVISFTADVDLCFEWEIVPITKAEIAHLLKERMTAIETGQFTRRQWRNVIHEREREIESVQSGAQSIDLNPS